MFLAPLVHCTGDLGSGDGDGLPPGGGCDDIADPDCVDDAPQCDEAIRIPTSESVPPDMLLVVDRSNSMLQSLPNGQSKWLVMQSALNTTVAAHGTGIKFGLMAYPGPGSNCTVGSLMSEIGETPSAITAQIDSLSPRGATPTSTTLGAALSYFNTLPVSSQGQYVILATDGVPNCANYPNSDTLTAIENLANAGIPTYVLGFGDVTTANPDLLGDMATAGGTGDFYPATSAAELEAALDDIAGDVVVAPCTYTLGQVPADPSRLAVSLDGVPLPQDTSHIDGWDYDAASNTVTLYGGACDSLQSGSIQNVDVDYGCGTIVD